MSWRKNCFVEGLEDSHMSLPDITGRVLDTEIHGHSNTHARSDNLHSPGAAYADRDFNILVDAPVDFVIRRYGDSFHWVTDFFKRVTKWTKSSISARMQQGRFVSASEKTASPRSSKRKHKRSHGRDDKHYYRSHVHCGDRVIDGRLIKLTLETIVELPEPDETR